MADFVGADRGLKRLALTRLDELELEPLDGAAGPALAGTTTLRDALSAMLSDGSSTVVVLDGEGIRVARSRSTPSRNGSRRDRPGRAVRPGDPGLGDAGATAQENGLFCPEWVRDN